MTPGAGSHLLWTGFPSDLVWSKNADVPLSHRDASQAPDVDRAGELPVGSPPAQRLRVQRWRDPRLWLGVLLVVVSVLAGAALFTSADDTVPVWAADSDVSAGMPLTSDEVHSVRVHFGDGTSAAAYLPADEPIPGGIVAGRDIAAGELIVAAAVDDASASPDRLPLLVTPAGLPAGLVVGDRVDVWAVPAQDSAGTGSAGSAKARQVLDDVTVSSLGAEASGGLGSSREVLVALPAQTDVAAVLDGLSGADVVLVLVGG